MMMYWFTLALPFYASTQASPGSYLEEHFKVPFQELKTSELSGGLSASSNYKVELQGKQYVLRIFPQEESPETRKREVEASLYAARLGIAPKIYYVAPRFEAVLMDFVAGTTLTKKEVEADDQLSKLLQTIRVLHDSTGDYPKGVTLFEKVEKELSALLNSDVPLPEVQVRQSIQYLEAIKSAFSGVDLVPCHNDLNALNILVSEGQFKLIDWTDAGLGTFYQDLGYFSLVNRIKDLNKLLKLYLQREPTADEVEKLNLMRQASKLRLFATLFASVEPSLSNPEEREKRKAEIVGVLQKKEELNLDQYFEMHQKGELNQQVTIFSMALTALRSFLSEKKEW
ncbi:choline/ethanolamine kinase family protein [Estrella lausannensis]|uniref:Phosphotransferase n=1 Tax=Estrella lausannensis TaxID=483423 RepID=A0A0H5DPI6_9BACT|nr:choline/ethanolamine kinase family protein [Estrella lausannensis]CRX38362.1 Phosphotransferase [Estrella lausannensis]